MIFKSFTPKPDVVCNNFNTLKNTPSLYQSPAKIRSVIVGAMLASAILITGCQPQSDTTLEDDSSQASEQVRVESKKSVPMSDSSAAYIAEHQPLYVQQMQSLQRRLQAEYEALQAADASDSDTPSLLDNAASDNTADMSATDNTANSISTSTADSVDDSADQPTAAVDDSDINISTEVGERDLEVLKQVMLEPREPILLSEEEIVERYQQAMQALYQPAATALSGQEADTLINIATLLPQLFEDEEIAAQVGIKSPALARLIIQHQIWEQIEAQQALDIQQLKISQQQEFESLMTKFNNTIEDYDKQIQKYEQTLETFQ